MASENGPAGTEELTGLSDDQVFAAAQDDTEGSEDAAEPTTESAESTEFTPDADADTDARH